MNTFKSWELAHLLLELAKLQRRCLEIRAKQGGAITPPAALKRRSIAIVRSTRLFGEQVGFKGTMNKAGLTEEHLKESAQVDISSLEAELRNVSDVLLVDIFINRFLQVKSDRTEYLDPFEQHKPIFGEAVEKAFPPAAFDIQEAGNCLAAECNTAAVFHLMRSVEWGLRALCIHLGLLRIRAKNKKSGKISYTPIEYSDWEHMLGQLNPRVDAQIDRMRKGPKKQKAQEFYYPVLQDIRAIRDGFRNHVVHTRREYSRDEAAGVLDHVRRIMVLLATRITHPQVIFDEPKR